MKISCLFAVLVAIGGVFAQDNISNQFHAWALYTGTHRISSKVNLMTEYQWRRDNSLKNWQQSLLRVGANYKISDNVIVHAGYAWVETFSYGKYPIANNGTFPEHRIYEQLTLRQPLNKFLLTHRFRVEQRWLGRVKANTDREIEEWLFLHRFRYQIKTQYPLTKKVYAAAADELFIGAGKNVGVNIFDQNRLFLLVGYKLNKNVNIESGYFNQTLQQGRRINNQTIMQRNNGLLVSCITNF